MFKPQEVTIKGGLGLITFYLLLIHFVLVLGLFSIKASIDRIPEAIERHSHCMEEVVNED